MDEPNEEPTEKPTNTKAEADREGAWMSRNWIAIATVSILGLLVIAVGLLQATGLIDLFGPIADSPTGRWIAFSVLAAAVIVIGAWSWRSVVASTTD